MTEENISSLDNLSNDELIEVTLKKFPNISRRQFLKLVGLLTTLSVGKRLIDIELRDWRQFSTQIDYYIEKAMKYRKGFSIGNYPDFEMAENPWNIPDQIKLHLDQEDFTGLFFNIEHADETNYPAKLNALIEQLYTIKQRNSEPVISIHTGLRPGNKHPFSDENTQWMEQHVAQFFKALDEQFPFPVTLRTFYEFNIPSQFAFVYGSSPDFRGRQHEEGLKKMGRLFKKHQILSPNKRILAFNPSVLHGFEKYYENGIYDSVGVDGYDIFPGRLIDWVDKDISFEIWLQLLFYYVAGRRTPEEVFKGPLEKLSELTQGNLPMYIYEIGSKKGDEEWIIYALWLLAALGGDGGMLFIYNKEYQVKQGKPFEANWAERITNIIELLAQSLAILKNRAVEEQ